MGDGITRDFIIKEKSDLLIGEHYMFLIWTRFMNLRKLDSIFSLSAISPFDTCPLILLWYFIVQNISLFITFRPTFYYPRYFAVYRIHLTQYSLVNFLIVYNLLSHLHNINFLMNFFIQKIDCILRV